MRWPNADHEPGGAATAPADASLSPVSGGPEAPEELVPPRPAAGAGPGGQGGDTAAPDPAAPPASLPEGTATTETIVWRSVEGLRPHAKAGLIPRMAGEQLKSFRHDVTARGVQEPIFITQAGVIIDGLGRWEAQRDSGRQTIACLVKDWDEGEQERHMLRLAARRRHLTDDQRAALAAVLYQLDARQARQGRATRAGKAGERGRARPADSSEDTPATELSEADGRRWGGPRLRQKAAQQAGVSERKLKDALEVQRRDPAAFAQVVSSETKLPAARRKARAQDGAPAAAPDLPPRPAGEKTAATDPGSGRAAAGSPVVLSLPAASPECLLDALVDAVSLADALALLRGAVSLGEARPGPAGG